MANVECPNCEYHKQRAQIWRDEAYRLAGHPLPERDPVLEEREACAKLCDSFYESWINIHGRYEFMGEGAQECAGAIRARGQA